MDKTDTTKFKERLLSNSFEILDGRNFTDIDKRLEKETKIKEATGLSCPARSNATIWNYEFTKNIRLHFQFNSIVPAGGQDGRRIRKLLEKGY